MSFTKGFVVFLRRVVTPGEAGNDGAVREGTRPFPVGLDRYVVAQNGTNVVEFAFFTGEEAGLLGSREYARRAMAEGKNVAAALNNDMVGYANDHRLDNTIRDSSAEVRDLQHAAALLFTDLILYDAHYYKSTDAHALYDAFGDVIGGIGSYPILANPHYHQEHDVLETIDQRLVAEVAKGVLGAVMGMVVGAGL